MQNLVKKLKDNEVGNYILPFLWMKGEDQTVIRTEIEKIYECGIRAICVEARPHPEFGKAGWWKDLGVVLEEAERLNIKVWILDDKHFPTGYANGLIAEKYPERKKVYLNYNVCDINGTGEENSIDINQMKAPGVVFWELCYFVSGIHQYREAGISGGDGCQYGGDWHAGWGHAQSGFDGLMSGAGSGNGCQAGL